MSAVLKNSLFALGLGLLAFIYTFEPLFFAELNQAQLTVTIIALLGCLAWATQIVPLFVTSFTILSLSLLWLLPMLEDKAITAKDIYSPFFSDVIMLFIGGFTLAKIIEKLNFDQQAAFLILSKTKEHAIHLVIGVVALCALLSMWMSNTATAALGLAIIQPIRRKIGKDEDLSRALLLALPFACNIGGIATPIGSPPNAIAIENLQRMGISIGFGKWLLYTSPIVLGLLTLLVLGLVYGYKLGDVKKFKKIDLEKPEKERGFKNWLGLSIIIGGILLFLISKQIGLTSGQVGILILILSFGSGLLDKADFRALPWDVLFLIAGGILIGELLRGVELTDFIVEQISQPEKLSVVFAIGCALTGLIVSSFVSNTATASIVLPVLVSLGFAESSTIALAIFVSVGCSLAMILPVSTPPNAIVYTETNLKLGTLSIAGASLGIFGLLTMGVGGFYLWQLTF